MVSLFGIEENKVFLSAAFDNLDCKISFALIDLYLIYIYIYLIYISFFVVNNIVSSDHMKIMIFT